MRPRLGLGIGLVCCWRPGPRPLYFLSSSLRLQNNELHTHRIMVRKFLSATCCAKRNPCNRAGNGRNVLYNESRSAITLKSRPWMSLHQLTFNQYSTCSNFYSYTPRRLLSSSGDSPSTGGLKTPADYLSYKSFEDHLFDVLSDEDGHVLVPRFLSGLQNAGLVLSDPRLRESMQKFQQLRSSLSDPDHRENLYLDRENFKNCVKDNIVLINRAFTGDLVLPEFDKFCSSVDEIYLNCKPNTDGKVADYIPQLSRFSPDFWGVSICTIDGQRYSVGDCGVPFCLQSCSKPMTYALALSELGQDVVHQYVGQEPSGESFNEIKLDFQCKPHNPMINAGAIVVASLIKNHLKLADRFDFVSNEYKKMSGGEYLSFNNAVFLSERETADRNFALGYYLKENKCFPDGINLMENMDFYFQLCSIEVTCHSASVIAATMANGGICPITGYKVLDAGAVRNTLSLMHSCGMYDYSGQFAFKVGLPGKSGVSGAILLVIPNVMGMCIWSPPLDHTGNSFRGLQFCTELVNQFAFHHFDNLKHTVKKADPRRRRSDKFGHTSMTLLFGAYNGDISALRRMALEGVDMSMADYDGRTALHVAAAEGHVECVAFLLDVCHVPYSLKDRWGHTPLDDASRFGQAEVVILLEKYSQKYMDNINTGMNPEHPWD